MTMIENHPGPQADNCVACEHHGSDPRNRFVVSRRVAIGAGVVAGTAFIAGCGGGSGTDTAGATAGAELAKAADIPAGGAIVVSSGNRPYVLAKKADGTVVAHTGVCTHQQGTVAASGTTLTCPLHGSKFDAFTGAVINGPATAPLAEVSVATTNGSVTVA
jgi:cytochrome b6-f complex iron-sulfur subunit